MSEEQPLNPDQLISRAAHIITEQEPQTRERALVLTKLQEAQMWLREHLRIKNETVRKAMGVRDVPPKSEDLIPPPSSNGEVPVGPA